MEDNQLLEWIKKDMPNRISILLRHSLRRRIPKGIIHHHVVPLTPKGRRMAFEFGKELPKVNLVRFFHSPIHRCKETAECMRKGVMSNGGSAVLMGERGFLSTRFITDLENMVYMLEKLGSSNFARKWLNGELEREIIEDPHKVASKIINGLVVSMKNDIKHKIDVHITHDLNILSVRDILLSVKHEEVGWPDYLDGVIFTCDVSKITLIWRNISKTLDSRTLNSVSPL